MAPRRRRIALVALILFLGIACIMGITITRLQAYRQLHVEIRGKMDEAFQFELASRIGGPVDRDRLNEMKNEITRLEGQSSLHMLITFGMIGAAGVCMAAALSLHHLRLWFSPRRTSRDPSTAHDNPAVGS